MMIGILIHWHGIVPSFPAYADPLFEWHHQAVRWNRRCRGPAPWTACESHRRDPHPASSSPQRGPVWWGRYARRHCHSTSPADWRRPVAVAPAAVALDAKTWQSIRTDTRILHIHEIKNQSINQSIDFYYYPYWSKNDFLKKQKRFKVKLSIWKIIGIVFLPYKNVLWKTLIINWPYIFHRSRYGRSCVRYVKEWRLVLGHCVRRKGFRSPPVRSSLPAIRFGSEKRKI